MIRGIIGTSLVDYPDKIATLIFTGGCNYRCPFCHNRELVIPEELKSLPHIREDYVIDEIKKRKGFVTALAVTGGEPLIHDERLLYFLKKVKKETNVDIKIDTNGSMPETINKYIKSGIINFFAVDLKTDPKRYNKATGGHEIEPVLETLSILKSSKIPYEIRTTVVPGYVDKEMIEFAISIGNHKKYVLQRFRPMKTIDKSFEKLTSPPPQIINKYKKMLEQTMLDVEVRI